MIGLDFLGLADCLKMKGTFKALQPPRVTHESQTGQTGHPSSQDPQASRHGGDKANLAGHKWEGGLHPR